MLARLLWFCSTGRRVFVEGKLQTRRWTGSDGVERFSTSIVVSRYQGDLILLDSPSSPHGPQQQAQYYGGSYGGGEGGEHHNSRAAGVDGNNRGRGVSPYRSNGPRGGNHAATARTSSDPDEREEERMAGDGQDAGDDDRPISDYDVDTT